MIQNKQTVMICQPMAGKTEEQIRTEREQVIAELEKDGYTVIDTIVQDEPDESYNSVPLYYLGRSLEFMSQVDSVYFMCDWEKARGCRIEHLAAISYDVRIMIQSKEGDYSCE